MTTLIADQGSFSLTGQTSSLVWDRLVKTEYVTYLLTGQGANLLLGAAVAHDHGSFSFNGQEASFYFGINLTSEQGSFSLTGQDAGSFREYVLQPDNLVYTLTGIGTNPPPAPVVTVTGYTMSVVVADNPKIKAENQKLTPDNLVVIFELDTTDLGGDILRFTSTAWTDKPIRYGGRIYSPIDVDAEGFEISAKGTLPTPKLRILNTIALQSQVIAMDDLVGATVRRIQTFKRFLDDGESPDPQAHYPIDIFRVDRKATQNKIVIEWELAASIDQEGSMLPARQMVRDHCTQRYRIWNAETESFDYANATCPYVGAQGYNDKDEPVPQSQDKCGKRLSSCKLRFPGQTLPTRAFPGIGKTRV